MAAVEEEALPRADTAEAAEGSYEDDAPATHDDAAPAAAADDDDHAEHDHARGEAAPAHDWVYLASRLPVGPTATQRAQRDEIFSTLDAPRITADAATKATVLKGMAGVFDSDEALWQSTLAAACERAFSLLASAKEGAEPTLDREAFWSLLVYMRRYCELRTLSGMEDPSDERPLSLSEIAALPEEWGVSADAVLGGKKNEPLPFDELSHLLLSESIKHLGSDQPPPSKPEPKGAQPARDEGEAASESAETPVEFAEVVTTGDYPPSAAQGSSGRGANEAEAAPKAAPPLPAPTGSAGVEEPVAGGEEAAAEEEAEEEAAAAGQAAERQAAAKDPPSASDPAARKASAETVELDGHVEALAMPQFSSSAANGLPTPGEKKDNVRALRKTKTNEMNDAALGEGVIEITTSEEGRSMMQDFTKRSKIRPKAKPAEMPLQELPTLRVAAEDEPPVDLAALRVNPQRKALAAQFGFGEEVAAPTLPTHAPHGWAPMPLRSERQPVGGQEASSCSPPSKRYGKDGEGLKGGRAAPNYSRSPQPEQRAADRMAERAVAAVAAVQAESLSARVSPTQKKSEAGLTKSSSAQMLEESKRAAGAAAHREGASDHPSARGNDKKPAPLSWETLEEMSFEDLLNLDSKVPVAQLPPLPSFDDKPRAAPPPQVDFKPPAPKPSRAPRAPKPRPAPRAEARPPAKPTPPPHAPPHAPPYAHANGHGHAASVAPAAPRADGKPRRGPPYTAPQLDELSQQYYQQQYYAAQQAQLLAQQHAAPPGQPRAPPAVRTAARGGKGRGGPPRPPYEPPAQLYGYPPGYAGYQQPAYADPRAVAPPGVAAMRGPPPPRQQLPPGVPPAGANLAYDTWMRGDAVERAQHRAPPKARGRGRGGQQAPQAYPPQQPVPMPQYPPQYMAQHPVMPHYPAQQGRIVR
ncbi:hypothetical protein AB1Y20_015675 [Prymnesium parvum]|uniref:Uncharacterized protein n=1 Tax=Prymnesium parvum TaxID=97485 RepID=A0AB34JYG2_PRYPA